MGKKKRTAKVERSLREMVEALRRHGRLLHAYMLKAFQERNNDYLGEVAGKLRILVGRRGDNVPLLLKLMQALDVKIPITIGGFGASTVVPPGHLKAGDIVSLQHYLISFALGQWTPSDPWVELTHDDVIHLWAQQHGAAHEDWKIDEAFVMLRDSGLFIGGRAASALVLNAIATTVFSVAEQFLHQATRERIAAAEARRQRPNRGRSQDTGRGEK